MQVRSPDGGADDGVYSFKGGAGSDRTGTKHLLVNMSGEVCGWLLPSVHLLSDTMSLLAACFTVRAVDCRSRQPSATCGRGGSECEFTAFALALFSWTSPPTFFCFQFFDYLEEADRKMEPIFLDQQRQLEQLLLSFQACNPRCLFPCAVVVYDFL